MGGNVFKDSNGNPRSVRLGKSDYLNHVCNTVLPAIRAVVQYETRVELVRHIRDKTSFGDADILVEKNQNAKESVRDMIDIHLNSPVSVLNLQDYSKNGDVWSLLWDNFQIDLIFISSENFDYARNYFAWNDFGNLIGRHPKTNGFKLGWDGLYWKFLRPDNKEKYCDILVTKDFLSTLEFFGYDSKRYLQGFDTLSEMFEFVVSSKYFDAGAYALELRSNKDRVRDQKRKVYRQFLEYLEEHNYQPLSDKEKLDRVQWIIKAETQFPMVHARSWEALNRYGQEKRFKSLFNANDVIEITGLQGPELGKFIAWMKQEKSLFEKTQQRDATVDSIQAFIKLCWNEYKN